ncbi:MAG TPA: lactoylglutathione lyase [Candidatus Binataceae bacterium]|nr:lactoylglutathione lyase [Candidatus Binataceae bacterium]
MKVTLDLPADVFDGAFTEDRFAERVRQWAILVLLDAHRLHEHEAAKILGVERWELVARMEAEGMRPTEKVFEEIRGELGRAVAARGERSRQGRTVMRFLHTMIRVNDLDQTLKFYCGPLGMKLLSRKDYPDGKFTLAFVGYGDENSNTVVELTHNWDTKSYDQGSAFGHLAIGVDDIYKTCDELKRQGVKVTREPGPMKFGSTVIAFVEDPNGYKIELIERK